MGKGVREGSGPRPQQRPLSMQSSVDDVKNGANTSTLFRRLRSGRDGAVNSQRGRPCEMPATQKKENANLFLRLASQGAPIGRQDIGWLFQDTFCYSFTLRFKYGKPGKNWFAKFCNFNKPSFSEPCRQAAERLTNTKAKVLTFQMSSFSSIQTDIKVDASRVFNLDDCVMSAG